MGRSRDVSLGAVAMPQVLWLVDMAEQDGYIVSGFWPRFLPNNWMIVEVHFYLRDCRTLW